MLRTIRCFSRKVLPSCRNKQNYSTFPDVIIPTVSLTDYIFEKCEKYNNFIATKCGLTGRKYTYANLIDNSKSLGRGLQKFGLKKGDVVALLLPNSPEFPIAVMGVLHAGLTVTAISSNFTSGEIYRQLSNSSAKLLITTHELSETASSVCKLLSSPIPTVSIKTHQNQSLPRGVIDFQELVAKGRNLSEVRINHDCQQTAFLPYSSGTTGLPKGVELTHYNIVANICQCSYNEILFIDEPNGSHQDIVPAVAPMYHIFGFFTAFFSFSRGAQIVTLPKFTSNHYMSLLRKGEGHVLFIAPPGVHFLTNHPMVKKEDLKSIRVTYTGGAPFTALDEERFLDKAGQHVTLLQGYGSSETITLTISDLKSKNGGSIGKPVSNTYFKVINPDDPLGSPLESDKTGELLVKGPQMMKGYLNLPQETKNAFLDGWFKTGDIGYYNEEGNFFITDRLKDIIKVKGFQVSPAEIELVMKKFPGVEEVAVIGVTHSRLGEAPRAYVVPKKDRELRIKDLEDWISSQLVEYKHLKGGVAVVDALPKTPSGKVLRKELKLDYEKSIKNDNS